MLILLLHVDDMIYGGSSRMIENFKKAISAKYKVAHQGSIHWILGMEVARHEDTKELILTQKKYINDILEKFQMTSCNPIDTPMSTDYILESSTDTKDNDQNENVSKPFTSLVGSLMFLAVCTRPDICFAVTKLARRMKNPREVDWMTAKKVLRYLKGTTDIGLRFHGNARSQDIYGYCDSDFAGDQGSRKSTTGWCFLLNGACVSWTSKLQSTIALLTAEAEVMAATSAIQEAMYLRRLLPDIQGSCVTTTTEILEDNQACLSILQNPIYSTRTKHVDIKYQYVKECCDNGHVKLL